MLDKEEPEKLSPIRYPSLPKAKSQKPAKKDERIFQVATSLTRPVPQEVVTYLLMKQKFDKLYKNIEKISLKQQRVGVKAVRQQLHERLSHSQSPEPSLKAIHLSSQRRADPEICKIRTSHLYPKNSLPDQPLQINTVSEPQYFYRGKNSMTPVYRHQQQQTMRKSHYKKKLYQPSMKVHHSKMSNNIKDYLSVERISLCEMQESLLAQKSKLLKEHRLSNLLGYREGNPQHLEHYHSVDINPHKQPEQSKPKNILIRRPTKFKPPFSLYYYRDFLWQIAHSNSILVDPVQQYQSKMKFYVGPGNNSNLIKGIMRRRPWWTLISQAKDASFVWTQIKVVAYFGLQRKGERLPQLIEFEDESPLVKNSSNNQKNKLTLLNPYEQRKWDQYWKLNMDKERKIKENLKTRNRLFNATVSSLSKVRQQFRIHNHFVHSFIVGNKKALFKTMSEYYSKLNENVFDYLPLTFHIKNGLEDDEYLKFLQHFYMLNKSSKTDPNCLHKYNAWIVKPGENTDRGNGIIVCLQLNQIKTILKQQQRHKDGTLKTYIIQKYIERPLLYKKRKFDLRHYLMLNCSNGRMKGYWYREGYVRTTSSQYTLKISGGGVHLTNDAVQKNLPDYGKFQKGNKVSYEELNEYIKKQDPDFDFFNLVYPKMKKIATDIIHASALNIDPERRVNNFQIFGLDFMIDSSYGVWLIEVNTNPCLETSCPVLNKIIPKFIENTFQICIDPIFPAPLGFKPKYQPYTQNLHESNAYELVFDQRIDGAQSIGQSVVAGGVEEEDDVFDDDGEDFDDDV